jgi:tetratricopeptide (TPR) repeat protein
MSLLVATALFLPALLYAGECTVAEYDRLVIEGRRASNGREWDRTVEIYSTIVGDCRPLVVDREDLAKAYDALSFGRLMIENYSAALDDARKCLEAQPQYNACMLTAAKAAEGLGDHGQALEYARAAALVDPYDDYSSAVGIAAKSLLKQLEKR